MLWLRKLFEIASTGYRNKTSFVQLVGWETGRVLGQLLKHQRQRVCTMWETECVGLTDQLGWRPASVDLDGARGCIYSQHVIQVFCIVRRRCKSKIVVNYFLLPNTGFWVPVTGKVLFEFSGMKFWAVSDEIKPKFHLCSIKGECTIITLNLHIGGKQW